METKRILVTGGAGFIGSTFADHMLKKGHEVVVFDSFIRKGVEFNTDRLEGAEIIRGDIRNFYDLEKIKGWIDFIYHTCANPGIKWSMDYPIFDFETNAVGTLNILEFSRRSGGTIPVVYCSTNKVYDGNAVNSIRLRETETRYEYDDPKYILGIPTNFQIDGNDHSMYGVSKLSGDLLCQEYSKNMGVPTIVNRMSCIGGRWQMGCEDQGWASWFVLAAVTGKKLNIYGDGKQVRDMLDGDDLARLVEIEMKKMDELKGSVFNVGGGSSNTMSLLECIDHLNGKTDTKIPLEFHDWRVADQKCYISDISKVMEKTVWKPRTSPTQLLDKIHEWIQENPQIVKFYEKMT